MFKDEVKLPFFRPCIKEAVGLICLVLGFTFDHSFGSKKREPLCPVFVFHTIIYAKCYL